MKTFNVSNELGCYIEKILTRRKIPYNRKENVVSCDLGSNAFHRIVIRARMEFLDERDYGILKPDKPRLHVKELADLTAREEVGDDFTLEGIK